MNTTPVSKVTRASIAVVDKALRFVRAQTATPNLRREAAKPAATGQQRLPAGYTRVARAEKNAADLTRTIDAQTEYQILENLPGELPQPVEGFLVMTEEAGILAYPEHYLPGPGQQFHLACIDPTDSSDNILSAFGGAVTIVWAIAEMDASGERASAARIQSAVIGDVAMGDIYWAEEGTDGAFVQCEAGNDTPATQRLQPDRLIQVEDLKLSCLNTKAKRIRTFFDTLNWLAWGGKPLNEAAARFFFHHGGPIPIVKVASGDIHAAIDHVGYKPIDFSGGVYLADKAGCKCAFFGPGSAACTPTRIPLAEEGATLGEQLLTSMTRRQRFCVAANSEVLDYCSDAFFKPTPARLLPDLREQTEKARLWLDKTTRLLCKAGHHDLARMVQRLFTFALPCFADSRDKNPIEHMCATTCFAAEICLGDNVTDRELIIVLTAALLHDIGQKVDEKVRMADIPRQPPQSLQDGIRRAIAARRAHMIEGCRIARLILDTYNEWYGEKFSQADTEEILRLIGIHDNPSCQSYQDLSGEPQSGNWLFQPDDRLALLLRCADRLFMIAGIDVDLARDAASLRAAALREGRDPDAIRVDAKRRLQDNVSRHEDEAWLYRDAFGDGADAYGFWCGLLYTSRTAYGIFCRELASVGKTYGIDIAKAFDIATDNVSVAGFTPPLSDYELYQLKNLPDTHDYGVTLVMGMPFPPEFTGVLVPLIDRFGDILAALPVTFRAYQAHHLHATLCPLVRTTLDPELYRRDPEAMERLQRAEVEEASLDEELIEQIAAETPPFELEIQTGNLVINGRGEVLIWGSAKGKEAKDNLTEFRSRMRKEARAAGRDKGSKIHITLGTIGNFHRLSRSQKRGLAKAIQEYWDSEAFRGSLRESGTTLVDRVRMVWYRHRSLAHQDEDKETKVFRLGVA